MTVPAARFAGPDVARAVAMLGVVVMNYHGYLIHRGARRDGSPAWLYDAFDPWAGPLATVSLVALVAWVALSVVLIGTVAAARRNKRRRRECALRSLG